MRKSFIYTLLLAVGVVLGITACSSDDDWAPGSVSGQQVFFANTLGSKYEISNTASSFTIPVSRYVGEGAVDVPLTVEMSEGSIFSLPSSISFADGETTTDLVVSYDPNNIEYGKYDTISVTLNDASLTTPYGITTYTFTAGITEWVKMAGSALFRDDMIASLWSVGNQIWKVNIYESALVPGRYKVEAPYSPATDFRKNPLWDNEEEINSYWHDTGNCDMYIDATDPNYVYFEYFDSGLENLADEGMLGMTSYVWYWLRNGNDLETVKSARADYFGKMEDGVIYFPTAKSLLMTMNGENELSWYGNTHSMMAIALPGAAFSDYSAAVVYTGIFTNPANEVFVMGNLTLGADATNVKAVIVEADVDIDALADAVAAGDFEGVDVTAGQLQLPMPADLSGKLQIVIVVIDNNEVKYVTAAPFEYFGGGGNPWKSLGNGYYTDDYVVTIYGEEDADGNFVPYDPETYEVEIEENSDTPGLYRLKKAYAPLVALFGLTGGESDIDVHAENPEGVYIPIQGTGADFGDGEYAIESYGGYLVAANSADATPAEVIAAYGDKFGKLVDGVITFPEVVNSQGVSLQGYLYRGGELYYYGGTNGASKIVLPGASAEAQAKAKRAAAATDFARRLSGKMCQGGSVTKLPVDKRMKKMPLRNIPRELKR